MIFRSSLCVFIDVMPTVRDPCLYLQLKGEVPNKWQFHVLKTASWEVAKKLFSQKLYVVVSRYDVC
jgi:hypothetical protein